MAWQLIRLDDKHIFVNQMQMGVICYNLLGAILDNIYGGQIDMNWLRETIPVSGDDSTEVQRVRYARAYIL
ncbi:hypothetical protein PVK06_047020 [Gossypium arboreum]|uniref:Uncharacterized protein n=1 Tax=Gossypium arboreum TaxID=29729 RepID=A0ABR0MCC2_GOSAR|nr:hypothetical protein PVK06_047020 [Gossypium arboreum]